jgi:hypothetical protein
MPDPTISQAETVDLCAKLDALELTPAQRALLTAILKIAADLARPFELFDEEFDGCFEPDEAAMIMAYPHAGSVSMVSKGISKSTGISKTRPT